MEETERVKLQEGHKNLKETIEKLHLIGAEMFDDEKHAIKINIKCKYADVVRRRWVRYVKPCILFDESHIVFSDAYEIDDNVSCSSISEDGKWLARVLTGKSEREQILVITNDCGFFYSYDLSSQKEFGKIYKPDDNAGCFIWSNDNNYLLFIAKKFEEDINKMSLTDCEQIAKCETFRLKNDLGEQLTEVSSNILVCFEPSKKKCYILKAFDENFWPSQFVWSPDSTRVYFIATVNPDGFCLGARYCCNRRSALYEFFIVEKELREVCSDNVSINCPRPSPNGHFIVFLTCDVFGPHQQCFRLVLHSLFKTTFEVAVDTVQRTASHADTFPGIYSFLPENCWCEDSRYIFFDGGKGFYTEIYAYDTHSKSIQAVRCPERKGSWHFLRICNNKCLIYFTDFNTPFALYLGISNREKSALDFNWIKIYEPWHNTDYIWNVIYSKNADDETVSESLLLERSGRSSIDARVIVTAHGGPNSRYSVEYNGYEYLLSFCRLGYKILMLNYIGSLCYGTNSLNKLTGAVGEVDITDCVNLINLSIERFNLNKDSLYYFGGSHGGFIGATLLGKHPSLFKAAVLRNPVCDTIALLQSTDIPDFVFSQYLGKNFDPTYSVTNDLLYALFKASPLRFNDIKAPTLFLLGNRDKRVPSFMGITYHRMLKARNVQTAVYLYPDNHSLSELSTYIDCFIRIFMWFFKVQC